MSFNHYFSELHDLQSRFPNNYSLSNLNSFSNGDLTELRFVLDSNITNVIYGDSLNEKHFTKYDFNGFKKIETISFNNFNNGSFNERLNLTYKYDSTSLISEEIIKIGSEVKTNHYKNNVSFKRIETILPEFLYSFGEGKIEKETNTIRKIDIYLNEDSTIKSIIRFDKNNDTIDFQENFYSENSLVKITKNKAQHSHDQLNYIKTDSNSIQLINLSASLYNQNSTYNNYEEIKINNVKYTIDNFYLDNRLISINEKKRIRGGKITNNIESEEFDLDIIYTYLDSYFIIDKEDQFHIEFDYSEKNKIKRIFKDGFGNIKTKETIYYK